MLKAPMDAGDDAAAVSLGNDLVGSEPELAARLFGRAAMIAQRAAQWSRAAGAFEREVAAWAAVGRVGEAAGAADRAVQALDRTGDEDIRLRVASNLAASLKEIGMAERAIALLEDVITRRRADLDEGADRDTIEALAAAHVNLATVLIDQGRTADGLAALRDAWLLTQQLGDPIRLATVRINEAFAYSSSGDLRLARGAYREAAELYRRGGAEPRDVGYAVRGEASTLAQVGRFAEALVLYRQADELFNQAGLAHELTRTAIGAVMAHASLGERIESGELDRLERQLRRLPPNEKGQLARNLGNIALNQGDHVRAERLYLRARRAFRMLGRTPDVASVDTNRAVAARRVGDRARAVRLLLRAHRQLEPLRRWRQLGHINHNLALVLTELADADGPRVTRLRAEALARSCSAVAALDRFRHDLPTAHDRITLEQSVYPGLFPVAIQAAINAGRAPTVAALVERARIQPVLPTTPAGMAYLEPRPVAARPGDQPVGGTGQVVSLAAEADRLAGADALWIGWWNHHRDLVTAITSPNQVHIDVRPLDRSLTLLAATLAIPIEAEQNLAAGDQALASRLALWRAARGPLLNDAVLADRLAATLPARARAVVLAEDVVVESAALNDAELLWPLSRLLLGDSLLDHLASAAAGGQRQPLVLAPPPLLGRVPWAALPLSDPAAGPAHRLIAAADLVVALPASLSASLAATRTRHSRGAVLLVADPLGDLRSARRLHLPDAVRLGHGASPATPAAFRAAVVDASLLVLAAHIRPGMAADPAASALLLRRGDDGGVAALTVAELAAVHAPPTCLVLGCDGAGAATGNEWTGVATGLAWAGAAWVVTTTWPVIDDAETTKADEALIGHVLGRGARHGVWAWQRAHAAACRDRDRPTGSAVYRWGGTVVTGSPGRA